MGKAFIVSSYLESPQSEKLAEYAGLARKVIEANGGQVIVRGCLPTSMKMVLVNTRLQLNLQLLYRQWLTRGALFIKQQENY